MSANTPTAAPPAETGSPEAAPGPVDSVAPTQGIGAAADIKEVVTSSDATIGGIVERLDSFSFDLGSTHVSLWSAVVVLIVIAAVLIFARLGSKFAHWVLGKMTRLDSTQKLLSEKLATIAVWMIVVLIGIDILGIDLTALAVFSGAFGLAIGFGLQKTFGNLIAGIILLMDRSIKPGDVIAVSDMSGRESFGQIRKIGIRAISVTTRDMKEYLIPNENLMINQVENWSYSSRNVRVKVPVGVAYGCDIELAEKLMLEAAQESSRVLTSPEPRVLLRGFGDSSVDFEVRLWISDPEEGIGGVQSDVLKRIWRLFKDNDIELPLPQRDLNIRNNKQFEQLVAALAQRVDTQAKNSD